MLTPILETVAREIMVAWINILYYILLFCILFSWFYKTITWQENNASPAMPKDCASMKLEVALTQVSCYSYSTIYI